MNRSHAGSRSTTGDIGTQGMTDLRIEGCRATKDIGNDARPYHLVAEPRRDAMEDRRLEGRLVEDRIEEQGSQHRLMGDGLLGFPTEARPERFGRAFFQRTRTGVHVWYECQVAECRAKQHGVRLSP